MLKIRYKPTFSRVRLKISCGNRPRFKQPFSDSCKSTNHESINQSIATNLKNRGPWIHIQDISPSQIQFMDATLSDHIPAITNDSKTNAVGNVPLGYHLAFFNDCSPESQLSKDGYHQQQAPDQDIFPARMWLGGSIEINPWSEAKLLKGAVGSAIEIMSKVEYQQKILKKAGPNDKDNNAIELTKQDLLDKNQVSERIDVTLDRYIYGHDVSKLQAFNSNLTTFVNDKTWEIHERRSLGYFTHIAGASRQNILTRIIKPRHTALFKHELIPTPVTLFRYSALTFNSHRIHYDPLYCQQVEGLPDCLVHGPLTVTLMMAWISSIVLPQINKAHHHHTYRIQKYSYRNLIPLFVNKKLVLNASKLKNKDDNARLDVWIENQNGSACASGTIYLARDDFT